jgi:hypothetical protein
MGVSSVPPIFARRSLVKKTHRFALTASTVDRGLAIPPLPPHRRIPGATGFCGSWVPFEIAQHWLYQDHILPAHYDLTVSGDTLMHAVEFEDLANDPEIAAEQEVHNRLKTQLPLADLAAGAIA